MAKKYTYKDALNNFKTDAILGLSMNHGKKFYNSQLAHTALEDVHYEHSKKLKGKEKERKLRLADYHYNCFEEQDNLLRVLTKEEKKAIYKKAMKK